MGFLKVPSKSQACYCKVYCTKKWAVWMSRLKKLSGWYIISKKLRGWIGAMQELYWIPLCPWIDMILQHGWLFLLIPVRCKTYFSSLKWSTKNFKSINNSRVFLAAIKFSQKQKREKDMAEEAFEKNSLLDFKHLLWGSAFIRCDIWKSVYLEEINYMVLVFY